MWVGAGVIAPTPFPSSSFPSSAGTGADSGPVVSSAVIGGGGVVSSSPHAPLPTKAAALTASHTAPTTTRAHTCASAQGSEDGCGWAGQEAHNNQGLNAGVGSSYGSAGDSAHRCVCIRCVYMCVCVCCVFVWLCVCVRACVHIHASAHKI